jgi:predicted RND superfamily exporter protein
VKIKAISYLQRFVERCIRHRVPVVMVLGIVTVFMAYHAANVIIKTDLDDLTPRGHEYVRVNDQFKQGFGGSNVVSIMVEAQSGDIFNVKLLEKVQKITQQLQRVDAVNQFQIISLASKKLKDIRGSTEGIDFKPLMWPKLPNGPQELAQLRESVLNNPLVLGAYVSRDLKSTLITVDFYDHLVSNDKVFSQVMAIAREAQGDGVNVRVVGAPILFGWVNFYLTETLYIFIATIALLVVLLFITARTWRGTLLPLLAGVMSAIWSLGAARLIGFNVDPLVIVVAFLITARCISHSVQLVTRFDDEIAAGAPGASAAATASMLTLFKPGMLGVIADAGCMIVVLFTPIALMHKVAIIGTIWVATISVSAVILTPVLLSWLRRPDAYAHSLDVAPLMQKVLNVCIVVATSRWRFGVLGAAVAIFIVSGAYALKLTVGDANPGSPILWQDAAYNKDAEAINQQFQGSDRMFVVFAGDRPDALKEPAVLHNISQFQKFMAAQPEVGGSLSLTDVYPIVQKTLRESNPRYQEVGRTARDNGELMYMLASGSDPGDMARLTDPKFQHGSVTLFFRDHQGDTIRTAISRVKDYVREHPVEGGHYLLAGGIVGVLAAVNEVLLSGQIESIALALLVLIVCCAVAYRSSVAGMFFMAPVVLSNTLTFSFMVGKGIGMNINTLPVAALGIGLGVDYAFYIVDGIKEELHRQGGGDLGQAIARSLNSAGRGVLITSSTLIVSVVLWSLSSLRFQAEMGILMAIWLAISSLCALFLMPAMVYIFKPEFIVGKKTPRSGVRSFTTRGDVYEKEA